VDTNNKTAEDSLGVRIKRLRIASGLTQGQLGTLIGVSSTAVGNWESGEFHPKGRYVAKLADALGIDVSELLDAEKCIDELAQEVQLLTAFRSLPKEHQLIAIKMLAALK